MWHNLEHVAQQDLTKLISEKAEMAVQFWLNLNYDKKCIMVEQLG